MFKRANKITALLVAAASIMSVVPAMAAERLGTKEGTIENAVAFKDGKYIYQGYRTDDDNKSVYYNAGDKDKELDDLTDATLGAKFDSSSVSAFDGSDEYIVDLATGKASDEDLVSDTKSTASDKLKSKLKKTDRYGDYVTIDDLTQVAANQFGDVWYQYKATTAASAGATGNTYYGYTDKTGKYVDADKTANIRVFNGEKMVKIDEFDEVTEGITATLDPAFAPVTIAQDKDSFYRVIRVNFSGATVYTSKGAALTPQQQVYLQKISKAQGDKEKDAYLPKTVESYELASAATLAGEGDIDLAYTLIMNAVADIADNNDVTYDDASGTATSKKFVGLRVIDGVIYYTEMDASDKVKTYKLKLNKNLKLDALNLSTTADLTDKIKVDAYAVKKDGDKDQDVKGNASAAGVSIDIDGNVWVVNQGKILKSEKAGDFKEMFTCDRSLDSLEVYDENSLVAWDASGDVYTTVQEGKAESEAEAPVVTPAKVGWDKLADGTWNFYDATGTKVVNNWANVGGVWYYLKADGAMATGWLNQNGTWYYLNASGAMATGWLNDNGTWYYLNASGAMLANTTVDGYVLGASGAWVK
ncbi:N-acetylmuramoyl-L-alanine amidase family protein [Clostridium chromiireducens]|uniref:Autolysin n=1 Tax=Clostridium chromiireducens TaxID=225345 RepID=A0A1V4IHS1_9CLOT|nr:N-acetylmuramoyl-L-alanine amidase family protein [Clostridium chromiireducens]OPJ59548.1 autolysin [Clostridium chromiireducens]